MRPAKLPRPADSPEDEAVYYAPHHHRGRYFNPWQPLPLAGVRELVRWKLGTNPYASRKRRKPRPLVEPAPIEGFGDRPEGARALWLGHASVLVEVDRLRVLVDPILGRVASVVPRICPAPVAVADLPRVDAVLLTHGHYDHADFASLRAIARRFGPDLPILLPRGLGPYLPRECRTRTEVDWWERVSLRGVDLVFVPAQHWHRRTATDTNRVLWGGWVIRGTRSVYHSGDTGFFGGFRAIRRALGPVDLAILPAGAYEPRWFMASQHMDPASSVRAWQELQARHLLAMHWGTFDLTDEPMDEGPRELHRIVDTMGLDPAPFHALPQGGSLGFE